MIPTTNTDKIIRELTLRENLVIDKLRDSGDYATIRIEKKKGKLVFISCENREKLK